MQTPVLTRRRFIGGCAAGLALGGVSRLSAQWSDKWEGVEVLPSSAWVKPGFELTYTIFFNTTEAAGATCSGGADGIATLPGKYSPVRPSDGRWYLEVRAILKKTGATVYVSRKLDLGSVPVAFNASTPYYGTVAGLRAKGDTAEVSSTPGARKFVLKVSMTPVVY